MDKTFVIERPAARKENTEAEFQAVLHMLLWQRFMITIFLVEKEEVCTIHNGIRIGGFEDTFHYLDNGCLWTR